MATAKKSATNVVAKKTSTLATPAQNKVGNSKIKAIKVAPEVKLPAVKKTKEEKSAEKMAGIERNEVLYRTTQVLVPLWFGTTTVEKAFRGPQLTGEAAICLMFVGADAEKGECPIGVEMNLRPSFDRQEAQLLVQCGFNFLRANKLIKGLKGFADKEVRLQNVVLTAKGQKIYDCAKRSMLAPFDKSKSYI